MQINSILSTVKSIKELALGIYISHQVLIAGYSQAMGMSKVWHLHLRDGY